MLENEELSFAVRGCAYEVYRQLGCGFFERAYENALLEELRLENLTAESQVPIQVRYKGIVVGDYFADLIVEESIIVELKAQQLPPASKAQLLNYMKATNIRIGMLVNFVFPKASITRVVL